MKKILLIATGGTIASSAVADGLTPAFNADQLLSFLPENEMLGHVTGITLMNIDSTNMNPSLMTLMAQTIFNNLDTYDGFVVSHGTDTMAYTAAALSYMLQYIKKPVVLMGSQMTIDAQYTDAKQNISDAITFAREDLGGVFIAFDGKLMLGTRTIKMKTKSTDAFLSVNFPTIATIKFGRITYNPVLKYSEYSHLLTEAREQTFQYKPYLCAEVFVLKMFPGINSDIFDYLKARYKGIVIESFGIGGIPNSEENNIVRKISELIGAGVSVVITTQCLEEGIDLNVYQVGKDLAKEKVIYSGDMNTEAIIMKLMWALKNMEDMEAIKGFIEKPLFGDKSF